MGTRQELRGFVSSLEAGLLDQQTVAVAAMLGELVATSRSQWGLQQPAVAAFRADADCGSVNMDKKGDNEVKPGIEAASTVSTRVSSSEELACSAHECTMLKSHLLKAYTRECALNDELAALCELEAATVPTYDPFTTNSARICSRT